MSSVPPAQHKRVSHAAAAESFASRDPVLAGLIASAGPIRIARRGGSHFAGLVEAIVYQQLAGAAAAAIHRRLVAALNDDVQPDALHAGLTATRVTALLDRHSERFATRGSPMRTSP